MLYLLPAFFQQHNRLKVRLDFFQLKQVKMTDKMSNMINNHLSKISDFIQETDLENAKEQLLDMFYAANTSEHLEDLGIGSRAVVTHYYIILLGLIEGIHWLGDSMIDAFKHTLSDDMNNFKMKCPYNCNCHEE
jgi:hypothetical protein